MMNIDIVVARHTGLQRQDLERWIANFWVRPDRQQGGYLFREIDVARVALIVELRDRLDIDEEALPVVLSLLDQVYDLRRRLRDLNDALAQVAPDEVRRNHAAHLAGGRAAAG